MTLPYQVLGIGNPIVDLILQVEESFLGSIPGEKGGSDLIEAEPLQEIIALSGKHPTLVTGGSAANTLKGLASLKVLCAFTGTVGQDPLGKLYTETIKQLGMTSLLKQTEETTGQSLCLVTPDGERTLRTFLGASNTFSSKDLKPELFTDVSLVHIEGYILLKEGVALEAMELAKQAGAKVSFDLASFEMIERFKKEILNLLSHVDILFANEDEVRTLTGLDPDKGCDALKNLCETTVVLLGEKGGIAARGKEKIFYKAAPATVVDTIGAGDLFASGFLYGYLTDAPLERCAYYGSITGAACVEMLGAEIPAERWKKIQALFHS